MTKRIQKLLVAVAALAALALGGAVFAQAQSAPATEHVTAVDGDNIQSGDQTTPDSAKKAARHHATEVTSAVDGDNVQSGDQTAPDTGAATETAGETSSESPAASDGPGGHADPAGANADHQFSGVE